MARAGMNQDPDHFRGRAKKCDEKITIDLSEYFLLVGKGKEARLVQTDSIVLTHSIGMKGGGRSD